MEGRCTIPNGIRDTQLLIVNIVCLVAAVIVITKMLLIVFVCLLIK